MNKLLAWFLVLLPAVVMAQDRHPISGKAITDIGNVEGVEVINRTNGLSAVTGPEGDFTLLAQKGDTLQFKGEAYKPLLVVLKQKDVDEELFVMRLDPVATMLDEVVVTGLTGNLAADSKSTKTMQVNTWFDPIDINKDVLPEASFGGANWITGFKQLFKKKKSPKRATAYQTPLNYVDKTLFSEVVRGAYPDGFFTETLSIPVKFIGAFLNFCDGDGKQYLQMKQNETELLEYLKNKSTEFLRLNPDARE